MFCSRFVFCICFLCFVGCTYAHGVLAYPNQRGSLREGKYIRKGVDTDKSTVVDGAPHLPAGDKSKEKGSGRASQIRELSGSLWKPFTPLQQDYKWFAGVCGDLKTNPQHLRPSEKNPHDGKNYYNDGRIVATYRQGGVISIELAIATHHNGFMEFHLCDVEKCGGEISEKCFRNNHCKQLRRAPNPQCDDGDSFRCGPIDPAYPGRWYLPCASRPNKRGYYEFYGGSENTILYNLPKTTYCKHCVLQWYWATANVCNPPGVEEYFTGADREVKPDWKKCKGQNGALGGFTKNVKNCGNSTRVQHYPEQFLQCADIAIEKQPDSDGPPSPSPMVTKGPSPFPEKTKDPSPSPLPLTPSLTVSPSTTPSNSGDVGRREPSESYDPGHENNDQRSGSIRDIVLVADGKRIVSLHEVDTIDIGPYTNITLEAVPHPHESLDWVHFFVNRFSVGRVKGCSYMFGVDPKSGEPVPWKDVPLYKRIHIRARTTGDTDFANIMFTKTEL